MPFTVATIHEINRLGNPASIIPRAPIKDVNIGKYKIKKVCVN